MKKLDEIKYNFNAEKPHFSNFEAVAMLANCVDKKGKVDVEKACEVVKPYMHEADYVLIDVEDLVRYVLWANAEINAKFGFEVFGSELVDNALHTACDSVAFMVMAWVNRSYVDGIYGIVRCEQCGKFSIRHYIYARFCNGTAGTDSKKCSSAYNSAKARIKNKFNSTKGLTVEDLAKGSKIPINTLQEWVTQWQGENPELLTDK